MWFSEHLGNRMGRITPAGVVTEYEIPTPNSQPRATALSRDGNVWFGEFAGGKIGRITPAGVITEFQIPTADSGPRALAAGPDGNVWFSEFNASKIGRITPQGTMTEFDLPRPNSGPGDITAGADGAMWFVELSGRMDGRQPDGNRIGRITLDGKITEYPIPSASGSPINIAVGPDRNIWFTKAGKLGRVTPDGRITEFDIPPGGGPTGLSAGSDRCPPTRLIDKLWFTAGNKIASLSFRP
jgi:streptogramin lyase